MGRGGLEGPSKDKDTGSLKIPKKRKSPPKKSSRRASKKGNLKLRGSTNNPFKSRKQHGGSNIERKSEGFFEKTGANEETC